MDTPKRRSPTPSAATGAPSGRVGRDDLGNAVWQWAGQREEVHGSFYHLGLSIAGEATPAATAGQPDASPGGQELYKKDHAGRSGPSKRRDLRALSRHIELQRRVKDNKDR